MQTLSPSVQERTDDIQTIEQPDLKPFISGPDTALWVGFGAFITIFLIVILLIIRGRVIAPAKRKMAAQPTFFEPAGEDVEITFEEAIGTASSTDDNKAKKSKRNKKSAHKEHPPLESEFSQGESDALAENAVSSPTQKRAPFANLFAKKTTVDGAKNIGSLNDGGEHEFAEVEIDRRSAKEDQENSGRDHLSAPTSHVEDDADDQFEAFQRAEAERQAYEEAEHARRAAMERERLVEEAREQARREAEFERRKAEAALEQRMQSVAAMQRKLSEEADTLKNDARSVHQQLDAALDDRFAALSSELNSKIESAVMTLHAPAREGGADRNGRDITAELADFFSREIKALRSSTEEALAQLSQQISRLGTTSETASDLSREISSLNALLGARSVPGAAGIIQLGDIVRNALPSNRYAFSQRLPTGRIADCIILPPDDAAHPIVIDAHFPVDAFNAYLRAGMGAGDKHTNEYRRSLLRHIALIAETMIIPEATEKFSILFAPSETIFNDLHTHFTDVIQDSYRARVWILSPTSLMATLHMLGAIGGRARGESEQGFAAQLRGEIVQLRQRIEALEKEAQTELSGAPGMKIPDAPYKTLRGVSAAYSRDPNKTDETAHKNADVMPATANEDASYERQSEPGAPRARPPFPLR